MTTCTRCRIAKENSQFYSCKRKVNGLASQCKECTNKYAKTEKRKEYNRLYSKKRTPARQKAQKKYTLKKYGISIEEYDGLVERQNGLCKICKSFKKNRKKRLCVDHDHSTGKIRGLLCDKCNRGIGLLRDSQETLANAIEYLKAND